MVGVKLPTLTITNKQYFRDGGIFLDSPADGRFRITADSEAKISAATIELKGTTIAVSGDALFQTGKRLKLFNDGISASGGYQQSGGLGGLWTRNITGSTVCGYLKVGVKSGSTWSYLVAPLFSSATGGP